jgi:hypothetical protein
MVVARVGIHLELHVDPSSGLRAATERRCADEPRFATLRAPCMARTGLCRKLREIPQQGFRRSPPLTRHCLSGEAPIEVTGGACG